ncbi:MAG: O-antigen ligase family protein, partial [Pirellulales bacterium]
LVVSDSSPERGDGIFFVVSWLILVAAWLAWHAIQPRTRVRFAAVDLAVVALALWYALAAIVATREGSPRAAINALWEWLALAAGFFMFRQMVRDRYAARALLATMVGVAVALSVVGYLQAFSTMPRDRAYYEQIKDDPQAMAVAVGHWYPPGSPERHLYEQRLYSTEPTATFSLANSLAGFLATWLVVTVGLTAIWQQQDGRLDWRDWLTGLGLTVVIAGCLLLTKSRSAIVATVVGLVLLTWIARPDWKRRLASIVGGLAATLILVITVAFTGWWDREVLTEASKSFAYRMQYWRATWFMITDHPWLGCGPGHFQQTYTAYRLPAASEEIRDPHNFFLELWATAGTPAAILLVAVLVLFFLAIRRSKNLAQDPSSRRRLSENLRSEPALVTASKKGANGLSADDEEDRAGQSMAVFGGGACGLVFAAVAAPVTGLPLSGITFATIAVTWLLVAWATHRWADRSAPVDRLAAVAVVVLLVNLSAAGGISYPGVAGSLWLLMAVGLSEVDSLSQIRLVPSSLMWGATAVAVAVAGSCYWATYRPVLESRSAIRQAQLLGPDRTVERTELLVRAVDADPLSTEAALLLADHRFRQWKESPSSTNFRQLRQAIERACRLAPAASHVWSQAGAWWWAVFEQTGRGEALTFAREAYHKAVDRYPNQATLRIRYAFVLEASGDGRAAATQAAAALKLDEVARHAGHRDQQLDTELRSAALRMASEWPG